MQLYIDYDNQRRVDGANAALAATPQLAYMSAPVWSIVIRSGGAALDVSAAVVLLRGEVAERLRLFGVQIADGDAAEQRHDRVAIAVKVNGR